MPSRYPEYGTVQAGVQIALLFVPPDPCLFLTQCRVIASRQVFGSNQHIIRYGFPERARVANQHQIGIQPDDLINALIHQIQQYLRLGRPALSFRLQPVKLDLWRMASGPVGQRPGNLRQYHVQDIVRRMLDHREH